MQNLVSDTKKDRDQLENFGPGPGKRKILVPVPVPGPLFRSLIGIRWEPVEFTRVRQSPIFAFSPVPEV
jgi:hypothetical protein